MLRFSRSETLQVDRPGRIVDGATAKAWLAGMTQPLGLDQLAEIAEVLVALGGPHADDAAPQSAQRKFGIADRIRAVLLPMLVVQPGEDRFKVLPLDDDFSRHFWAVAETGAALRDAYAWLVSQLPKAPADDGVDGEAPGVHAATTPPTAHVSGIGALHRALDVGAQLMVAIQRARWGVPAAMWERHCVLGQLVRELDCQDVEIGDAQRLSATKTCRAAFVLPVMVALADPASRSGPEFEVVRLAAQRWSAKMGFRLERRSDAASSSTVAPARPFANPGPSVALGPFALRFDTQSAMQSIDKRLEALAEGRSPRDVGIGDGLRGPAAQELLRTLKQRWGSRSPADIDSPDRAWRASTAGAPVLAMVGMPEREATLSRSGHGLGAAMRGVAATYDYQRMKEGGITQPREQLERSRVRQLLEDAETWTLDAESADAVRCVRKHARPRIGLHRLVGLKLGAAGDGAPFLLGWVEALQGITVQFDDGRIRAGSSHSVRVRLAPGLPQPLTAAIDDVELESAFLVVPGRVAETRNGATRPAAFVPMLSDCGVPPPFVDDGDGWEHVRRSPREYGLVLPHASFRPQRLVRAVRQGVLAMLRLEELMMRGSDFDLVRFIPL